MFLIADVLTPDAVATIRQSLFAEDDRFVSGKSTAGWYAREVKDNDQSTGPAALAAMQQVETALMTHPVFKAAARPKKFVKTLVSRYKPGMQYGTHVDDALMGGMRTDLSFTLFLSAPEEYEGGELVIEALDGENANKLPPGHLVLYQTTSLHRVNPVTRGERLAIVGWVRSFIRNVEQRETLFELDQIVAGMVAAQADRAAVNPVMKVRNTLTRMWAED
jgi:PKHD-type hydroxylase